MPMLEKLNRIKTWQASLVLLVVGFATYWTGLTNPFQGDDIAQIVNNVPVHSIAHIKLFFEGGTFYNGQGLAPSIGTYFRPLMTTVFSLLYTLFGPHPFYFHFLQLLLCIGSAIILYLFFRFSFKPALALLLALIFLVHPLNSQVAFYIPNMQDALFFFFGILALYLLIRFKSIKSLLLVAVCLLLSLLSKESGILFVALSLLYLFWCNRQRLYWYMGISVVPVAVWFVLRLQAIGFSNNPNSGPIDSLGLAGRLMTAPSIVWFYITKFLFPFKLAYGYYWVYPNFSIRHVLLPAILDLAVVALVVYAAVRIRKRATKAAYTNFLFFGIWTALGLAMIVQIIPLDMTASEAWFYFPMAGMLGMIGVAVTALRPRLLHLNRRLVMVLVSGLLVLLCLRTAFRGTDYESQYILAKRDIAVSDTDYVAYNDAAQVLISQGKYSEAQAYVARSMSIYPTSSNYLNLGAILAYQGKYPGAVNAFDEGLQYAQTASTYQNLARLTLVYGNPVTNKRFLLSALSKYPQDYILWTCLALFDDQHNNVAGATIAIANAQKYGAVPQYIYDDILSNQAFLFNVAGKNIVIY